MSCEVQSFYFPALTKMGLQEKKACEDTFNYKGFIGQIHAMRDEKDLSSKKLKAQRLSLNAELEQSPAPVIPRSCQVPENPETYDSRKVQIIPFSERAAKTVKIACKVIGCVLALVIAGCAIAIAWKLIVSVILVKVLVTIVIAILTGLFVKWIVSDPSESSKTRTLQKRETQAQNGQINSHAAPRRQRRQKPRFRREMATGGTAHKIRK